MMILDASKIVSGPGTEIACILLETKFFLSGKLGDLAEVGCEKE